VEVKPGDFVSVSIEALEDGYGATRLSRDKAKRIGRVARAGEGARDRREDRRHDHRQGEGRPHRHGEGHQSVPCRARWWICARWKDTSPFEGKRCSSRSSSSTAKRNNVVVSRRAVLEETRAPEREHLLASLQEGATVKGIVKNINRLRRVSSTWAGSTACCTSPTGVAPREASSRC